MNDNGIKENDVDNNNGDSKDNNDNRKDSKIRDKRIVIRATIVIPKQIKIEIIEITRAN